MPELYFHQFRNRDVGPLSAYEVRQRIRAGQIQPSDKIRADGESQAHAAREFLAFREEIERVVAHEANGRRWICLRAQGANTGSAAAMRGPYTRGEIIDLLLRHELSASDYVWREGFTSWKRLDSVTQLRLPVPSFPRSLIPWNNSTHVPRSLDWDSRERSQPRAQAAPEVLSDRTLTAALTLVCGLLAVVIWRLMAPHLSAFTSRSFLHASRRAAVSAPLKRPVYAKASKSSVTYSRNPKAYVAGKRPIQAANRIPTARPAKTPPRNLQR